MCRFSDFRSGHGDIITLYGALSSFQQWITYKREHYTFGKSFWACLKPLWLWWDTSSRSSISEYPWKHQSWAVAVGVHINVMNEKTGDLTHCGFWSEQQFRMQVAFSLPVAICCLSACLLNYCIYFAGPVIAYGDCWDCWHFFLEFLKWKWIILELAW